jgi:hypothetical protein
MYSAPRGVPPLDVDDHLSEEQACALAFRIEDYWRERGIVMKTTIVKMRKPKGAGLGECWTVRSDLKLTSVRR